MSGGEAGGHPEESDPAPHERRIRAKHAPWGSSRPVRPPHTHIATLMWHTDCPTRSCQGKEPQGEASAGRRSNFMVRSRREKEPPGQVPSRRTNHQDKGNAFDSRRREVRLIDISSARLCH